MDATGVGPSEGLPEGSVGEKGTEHTRPSRRLWMTPVGPWSLTALLPLCCTQEPLPFR